MIEKICKFNRDISRFWKMLTLVVVALFFGGLAAGAGVITYEETVYVSYMERFQDAPISDLEFNVNYTRVTYTPETVRFLERFDPESSNNFSYSEVGEDTANSGFSINTGSVYNATLQGDGTNTTWTYYNQTATSANGGRPTSAGVIFWAAINQTVGTPWGGVGLSDGTYHIYLGFDGAGNIDLQYHNAAGTDTNAAITTTITTNRWYYLYIEYYATHAIIKVYNEKMTQLGDTTEVTVKMQWANYDIMFIRGASESATDENIEVDWIYTTRRVSSPDKTESEYSTDNETTGAPASDQDNDIEFSYSAAGIDNDSASAESRLTWNYDERESDYSGTKTYNSTDFEKSMYGVSEIDTDMTKAYDYLSVGYLDLQDDTEAALKGNLEDLTDTTVHVVDYYVNDYYMDVEFSEEFQELNEEFYKKEAVDVILDKDPEAEITFADGSVMTASMVPRECLEAWILGIDITEYLGMTGAAGLWDKMKGVKGSIDRVQFTKAARAEKVRESISKEYRKKVGTVGLMGRNIKTAVSPSANTWNRVKNAVTSTDSAGTVKKWGRSWVSAPTNYLSSKLASGKTVLTTQLGSIKDRLTSTGKFVKDRAFGAFGFMAKIGTQITRYLVIGFVIAAIIIVIIVILYIKYGTIGNAANNIT